ncbi:hypothetical protein JCM3774_004078 [Rhodotorula dairenensis]
MQLVLPPAINSKSDPQTAEADIDYSMTAPLNKDGSNFPAKKYATKAKLDSIKPVATLVAGQEFSWNLGGTAVHNGGSCQVAISYDLMETMVVIASWIGGCPLSLPYKFKVPDIPGCDKCFFIWDWFNKAGNREMYQNAAVVSISGTAKQFVGPQIYRANTFGEDICETTEGVEVVFPAPGDQVFYAAGTSANSPATDLKCPGWDNKKIVTVTGPGNGPKATAPVGGATGSPATDTKALNGSPPAGTGTGTAAAKPTNSGATGGAATSSEAAGPESSAGGDSEPTGAGAPPSTGGAETTATLDTSPDDADSESLIGSGNNNRTFLLFAGGFVALIVLAGQATGAEESEAIASAPTHGLVKDNSMLASTSAPRPPSPRTKLRPLSQSYAPSTPLDHSPSLSRSYRQPVGTGSLRRSQLGSGHGRSRSQGDPRAGQLAALDAVGGPAVREVFCDVVVSDLELDATGKCAHPTGPIASFVDSLGEIVPADSPEAARRPPSRPNTPGPAAQPDIERVRRSLHELWVTEQSYLRKITSLLQDYAQPLRTFSKKRETAIIPAFEATHLFINIEQLVPISAAFERDLQDVVHRAQNDRTRVPQAFGEMILAHVERMAPYKKWLANVSASETIRRDLDKHNSSFREFVERTQIHSRETAQSTGGFKEFLAEPFQRVSRYRLMIDPIIQHLEPGDPNIEPLQIASTILSDICSMEIDRATQRAAVFWSLKETIDGFPDSLVDSDRRLIATIDADEVIEVADSRPTTLRCTLFLFDDKLLIAKRPSGDKQGKVHAAVDDLDRTVALYQTSHLSTSQASTLGSPKKLRKGVLGFRGVVDIAATAAIDLGERSSQHDFGLVFDHPPVNQSERWTGRPARRFVVAHTHAADARLAEKKAWLEAFTNATLRMQLSSGAIQARRGSVTSASSLETGRVRINWSLWRQRDYEQTIPDRKGKLALLLTTDGAARPLATPSRRRPLVSATATFLDSFRCRFEVYATDSPGSNADIIEDGRVAAAVASIATSYGIDNFPTLTPISPSSGRSRTRSNLLSVLDVFSGGNGLKRGNSLISKSSSTATTTLETASLSGPSQRTQLTPPARRPLNKHSAPDLSRSVGSAPAIAAWDFGDDERVRKKQQGIGGRLEVNSRSRPRRSISLPPPPSDAPSSSATHAAFLDAPSPVDTITYGFREGEDYAQMVDMHDTPMARERPEPMVQTSPMAYRHQSASPRRRMMGPRDMRGAESVDEAASDPSSARDCSPSPVRRGPRQELASGEMCLDEREAPPRSASSNALSKRARPAVEPSPRPSPAKKMASRLPTDAAFSASTRAIGRDIFAGPSESADIRSSRRVVSGASVRTVRASSPPRHGEQPDVFSAPQKSAPSGPVPATGIATFPDDEPMADPFDLLRKHVDDMRLKLSRELANANKENERIVSPTALTRSPQTRNVFGKAIPSANVLDSPAARLSKAASGFPDAPDPRPRHKVDFNALSEWTRRLADLIDACEASAKASMLAGQSPKEEAGSTKLEMAMLEQERDLIAAELATLKSEMLHLQQANRSTEIALSDTQGENTKLRQAYMDICGEADALHADFNAALESVHLAAQAEPSATGEYIELTAQLSQAVASRFEAEHQLRLYRRAVQAELEEKERWAVLLRQHGLIP